MLHMQEDETFAQANQTASEAFTNIRTIAAFGMEGQVRALHPVCRLLGRWVPPALCICHSAAARELSSDCMRCTQRRRAVLKRSTASGLLQAVHPDLGPCAAALLAPAGV